MKIIYRLCQVLLFMTCAITTPDAQAKANILLLGDSLSSAFGIAVEQSWVTQLEQKIQQSDWQCTLINASIAGDTTAQGLARLPVLIEQYKPSLVIIALGGNDGLRGLSLTHMRENLQSMITQTQKTKADVILVAVRMPPNYGPEYLREFAEVYLDLAKTYNLLLVPNMLANVGEHRELMQADNIHPTQQAQSIIFKTLWQAINASVKQQCTI